MRLSYHFESIRSHFQRLFRSCLCLPSSVLKVTEFNWTLNPFGKVALYRLHNRLVPAAKMLKSARTRDINYEIAALQPLPDNVLNYIIRALSFQDKCSLTLIDKSFYRTLSSPLRSEELWGKCDLMSDLRLDKNFDRKEEIMR